MPSKKRKYNARFPAGRIKKIMQTDEEVGKVAQAVPIIISRTLELFVESLLSKALQVTVTRNAKTLSPSHVKQCILAESRFDFLRDLVKNIPDVSAAEEKELMSAENSPNSSRFSEISAPPRRIAREDSNSSSSSDVRVQQIISTRDTLKRGQSSETDVKPTATATIVSGEGAVDLTKKHAEVDTKPVRTAPNFYQETMIEEVQHRSVITPNPTYATAQPSTSSYSILKPVEQLQRRLNTGPNTTDASIFNIKPLNNNISIPVTPKTPVTPILNIDFTKNLANPEIKVLDSTVAHIVGVKSEPNTPTRTIRMPLQRQHSKPHKTVETKKVDPKPSVSRPVNIDYLNSGNLQIDEDYDT